MTDTSSSTRAWGTAVSPGLAVGSVQRVPDSVAPADQDPAAGNERRNQDKAARIDEVLARAQKDLEEAGQLARERMGKHAAMVFSAQQVMLSDPELRKEIERALSDSSLSAEQVVDLALSRLSDRLDQSTETTAKQHSEDLRDLRNRIVGLMGGAHAWCSESLEANTVLGIHRLLPSDVIRFSSGSPAAVLAGKLEPNSHAALLLRGLGIPCVAGVGALLRQAEDGDTVLVDGTKGVATLNPDRQAETGFRKRMEAIRPPTRIRSEGKRPSPASTRRGIQVRVLANAGRREEVQLAVEAGAEGVGLFRTEGFFLLAQAIPKVEEFRDYLEEALAPAPSSMVVNLRLADLGGDRRIGFMDTTREPNPALGCRGIRFLLNNPHLLDVQLRAILRLSGRKNVRILLPMVTLEEEMAEVCRRLGWLAEEEGIEPLPSVGAMVETPAAALSTAAFRQQVEFLSIGTNDLTQFTMAACRENPLVAHCFREAHPALLRLLSLAVRDAADTEISLCGTLAGNIPTLSSVLGTGIRTLSVPPPAVDELKQAIGNIDEF